MDKEEAKKVKPGTELVLIDDTRTPGRDFDFPRPKDFKLKVHQVHEENGYIHFGFGINLPENAEPLMSRDSGEEIDGSNTYWMHPSRFKIN